MIPWDLDLFLLALLALLTGAASLLTGRGRADVIGAIAGAVTLVAGSLAVALRPGLPPLPWPLLDAVSLPQVPVTGLVLVAVFLTLPRRHRASGPAAALLGLAAVHLLLVATPPGPFAGALWAVGCALSLGALPAGPARRLAMPYLALAAGTGLAGSVLGGGAGAAMLLFAVAARMGLFPLHTWAVGSYTLAPTTVAVAVLAPMQALDLVARLPLSMTSSGAAVLTGALVASASVAAGLALVQVELARAVGFLTVAAEAVVLVGVIDTDHVGHTGGLMMWGVTSLALVGLGLVSAALRARRGRVDLGRHLGLARHAPLFAGLFLLFGLAAVGAPGTADFVSEDLVLHGSVAERPLLLVALIAAVSLQGYAVLHLFYRVFLGPPVAAGLADALRRERVALLGLAALLVLTGLVPQLLVRGGWGIIRDVPSVATEAGR